MKAVVQRAKRAAVTLSTGERREIGAGLMVLFGAGAGDELALCQKLAEKTAKLRIFSDGDGKMNLSALDLGLEALVVSQFTLFADSKKGNRPSFIGAAPPAFANEAYEEYVAQLKAQGIKTVKTGEFGDDMLVSIENDGPVTIILDTEEWQRQ